MAELKTKPNNEDVERFLDGIADERMRDDCRRVATMMREATGAEPRMWGESIVGFGDHHYRYASGREGDWFLTGFSPRKRELTLYLWYGLEEESELRARLGKHKVGKACLYLKRLDDADQEVLRELIQRSLTRKASSADVGG